MATRPLRFAASASPRFERHAAIPGWDQERLVDLGVAVFGAGALGNEVLQKLALIGVGRILIVDFDRVEPSNLARSPLFRAEDAGRPKALVAAERVRELWPDASVRAVVGDLHLAVGPGLLAQYDLALSCVDSIDARLGLNRLCRRAGVPWWNGALGPFSAEVQRFDPKDGPCFACGLSDEVLRREALRWSCQSGRPAGLEHALRPTTAVAASLGAGLLVGEMLLAVNPAFAADALPPGGRRLLEGMPFAMSSMRLGRDRHCLQHEDRPGEVDVHWSGGPETSAREVVKGLGLSLESVEVHLPFDLIAESRCGCPAPRQELLPLRQSAAPCSDCGQLREVLAATTSFAADHPFADRPLQDFSVPAGGELVLASEGAFRIVRLHAGA